MVVTAYVISAVGIPVFLHYCGGELEKINYVMKSTSCCGGEEDDSEPMDDGCCKDENMVIKNNPDFTLKQNNTLDLVKTFCDLFYLDLPFSDNPFITQRYLNLASIEAPPPKLQNTLLISSSVLRI
ncbi:MAG: hypothetical protein H0W73_12475 [Bacteroidetes bacterium]|nr:hypothetical protein [Bacteroidota bacterium]